MATSLMLPDHFLPCFFCKKNINVAEPFSSDFYESCCISLFLVKGGGDNCQQENTCENSLQYERLRSCQFYFTKSTTIGSRGSPGSHGFCFPAIFDSSLDLIPNKQKQRKRTTTNSDSPDMSINGTLSLF